MVSFLALFEASHEQLAYGYKFLVEKEIILFYKNKQIHVV